MSNWNPLTDDDLPAHVEASLDRLRETCEKFGGACTAATGRHEDGRVLFITAAIQLSDDQWVAIFIDLDRDPDDGILFVAAEEAS
ncbi:MAG: hypothetical protein AAGA17_00325 [Actinomycetota bacterium]